MLLTISYSRRPATDLGHLLHKHPERVQSVDLNFGQAHVFYPEVSAERCTAALLLDIDPVGMVRGPGSTLDQYVNDRSYVSSSMLSVAMTRVFGTALSGRSKDRQEAADTPSPLECTIAALPCRGGETMLRRLFEPLGYSVEADGQELDPKFPEWGPGPYLNVRLAAELRLRDLLKHVYVLVPVLDNGKHYWVGSDEVAKLLRKGDGWLDQHPERDLIVRRYLKHQRSLAREALARLVSDEGLDPDENKTPHDADEAAVEERISLNEQRVGSVLSALRSTGTRSVVDLGCGEGRLLAALKKDVTFLRIVGVDVSHRALERAEERLQLDRLGPGQRDRISLWHGSLLYRDQRLNGFDAATVIEVIEHLDPPRLSAFERVLFEFARPKVVVVTTPNREYNRHFPTLPAGSLRHSDHRFEWSRDEFHGWAAGISERFGYTARFLPVGPEHREIGPPTQMCVFSLVSEAAE